MSISNVSFAAGRANYNNGPEVPSFMNEPRRSSYSQRTNPRQAEQDSYKPSKRRVYGSKKRHNPFLSTMKTVAATLAAVSVVNVCSTQVQKVPAEVTVPYTPQASITELAEIYDVDVEAIIDHNNIISDNDLLVRSELVIPSDFDYVQEKIETLKNKLYDEDLTVEERNEIQETIQLLEAKKEYQDSIATVYTDGKYVYFEIKDASETFSGSINVEKFKNVFDIKDGEMRRYNMDKIKGDWEKDTDFEFDDGYFDYTGNYLTTGETYKVKVKSIESEEINLDY